MKTFWTAAIGVIIGLAIGAGLMYVFVWITANAS